LKRKNKKLKIFMRFASEQMIGISLLPCAEGSSKLFNKPKMLESTLRRIFLMACLLVFPGMTKGQQRPAPPAAYVVVDFYSKKIVSSHNAEEPRSVASLTKIAAAMVTLDWAKATNTELGVVAIVPNSAAAIGGGNPLGLQPGDEITLRNALYGAIIGSDNICAETLAVFVGNDLLMRAGKQGNPMTEFVRQMNNLATTKGAVNTNFVNAHGMDNVEPRPYSCAADVARLSIYAMEQAAFTFFCSQKERKVEFSRQGQSQAFLIKNTNKLLGVDSIDGVKTGMTRAAGGCVAISAKREPTLYTDAEGVNRITHHRLVVVVLGAPDLESRFVSAQSLLKRGWEKLNAWNAGGRKISTNDELLLMEEQRTKLRR
jgi:D-alanyl-D-alanine carboxypeptidase (penicillin-binding protein 5/6)